MAGDNFGPDPDQGYIDISTLKVVRIIKFLLHDHVIAENLPTVEEAEHKTVYEMLGVWERRLSRSIQDQEK